MPVVSKLGSEIGEKSLQRWVNICRHRIKYDFEFGQISIVTLKQTEARKLSDFMLRNAALFLSLLSRIFLAS